MPCGLRTTPATAAATTTATMATTTKRATTTTTTTTTTGVPFGHYQSPFCTPCQQHVLMLSHQRKGERNLSEAANCHPSPSSYDATELAYRFKMKATPREWFVVCRCFSLRRGYLIFWSSISVLWVQRRETSNPLIWVGVNMEGPNIDWADLEIEPPHSHKC